MRRVGWLLVLALACGPRPLVGPEAPDLRPVEVGRAFATAVLEEAREVEALRWVEPDVALGVRSQVGFLSGPGRKVVFRVETPRQQSGSWVVAVPIESLTLGEVRYIGQMQLQLREDGRRVSRSVLLLERSDGVRISL
mgnify:CR=1 FL=1